MTKGHIIINHFLLLTLFFAWLFSTYLLWGHKISLLVRCAGIREHADSLPCCKMQVGFWLPLCRPIWKERFIVFICLQVTYYPEDPGKGYSYADGTHIVTTKSVSRKGDILIYRIEHAIEKRNVMKDPPNYKVRLHIMMDVGLLICF